VPGKGRPGRQARQGGDRAGRRLAGCDDEAGRCQGHRQRESGDGDHEVPRAPPWEASTPPSCPAGGSLIRAPVAGDK
jgi:hypothetical protein